MQDLERAVQKRRVDRSSPSYASPEGDSLGTTSKTDGPSRHANLILKPGGAQVASSGASFCKDPKVACERVGYRYSKAGAPNTKKQEKDQEGHRSCVKTVSPKQSGNEERCAVLKLQERQADEQIDVTQMQLAWTPIASASSAREDLATAATKTTATATTPSTTNSQKVRHAKVQPETGATREGPPPKGCNNDNCPHRLVSTVLSILTVGLFECLMLGRSVYTFL